MPADDRIPNESGAKVVIKDRGPASGAALPAGGLTKPFLGRQGDEQRQPSSDEIRKLAEIKTRLRRGEKA